MGSFRGRITGEYGSDGKRKGCRSRAEWGGDVNEVIGTSSNNSLRLEIMERTDR